MATQIDAALHDSAMAQGLGAAARDRVLNTFTLDHAIRALQISMGLSVTPSRHLDALC